MGSSYVARNLVQVIDVEEVDVSSIRVGDELFPTWVRNHLISSLPERSLTVAMHFVYAITAVLVRYASAYTCTNLTVPVELSARNGVFDYATPQTNIDVTNFFLRMAEASGNYSETLLLNASVAS